MSSLSESERIGLDDVFMCLGNNASLSEKINEHKNRMLSSLTQLTKKSIPIAVTLVKSQKIMFKRVIKVNKTKLFTHFRPKSRGSK